MQRQKGFTLVELVVVIVILGILAATALPRFADLQVDARVSKLAAARSSLQAGAAMAHSSQLVQNLNAASAVSMEGTNNVAMSNAYPTVVGVQAAAGGLSDYSVSTAGTVLTVATDAAHPNCKITYTEAASLGVAPVLSAFDSATVRGTCQ